MSAYVGISGWRYAPWRGQFYPPGLPERDELKFAAERFPTIELNGSFYSLQRPEYYERWYEQVPDDFVFEPATFAVGENGADVELRWRRR